MEQKRRSSIVMLSLALVLSLVEGALGACQAYLGSFLRQQGVSFSTIGMYATATSLVSLVIDPILIFIGFYSIGKGIDLDADLAPTTYSLISGAYIGNVVGYVSTALFLSREPMPIAFFLSVGLRAIVLSLQFFFVAFTALALAYIRQHRLKYKRKT